MRTNYYYFFLGTMRLGRTTALAFGLAMMICTLLLGLQAATKPAHAATTFMVDRSDDPDLSTTPTAGDCTTATNDCSLRGAIIAANNSIGADTVAVPAGTYTLSTSGAFDTGGDLDITDSVTITGAGARTTTISGGNAFRVLEVGADNTTPTVSISGVTIAEGSALASSTEGGIAGGIFNSGTLTITTSTIRDNQTDGAGGGIENQGNASLTVEKSTISGNKANQGGGIYNSGSATGGGSVTLINSTLSGNEARGNNSGGGGIASFASTNGETIKNTTIAFNTADGPGGGVFRGGGSGPMFKNTIVAKNISVNFTSDNCTFLTNSQGNNLSSDGSCDLNQQTDKVSIDPLLGVLKNNGGPTNTHALGKGSPAINAGGQPFEPTDQRGVKRPQGKASDIGAYEKKVRRR